MKLRRYHIISQTLTVRVQRLFCEGRANVGTLTKSNCILKFIWTYLAIVGSVFMAEHTELIAGVDPRSTGHGFVSVGFLVTVRIRGHYHIHSIRHSWTTPDAVNIININQWSNKVLLSHVFKLAEDTAAQREARQLSWTTDSMGIVSVFEWHFSNPVQFYTLL